MKLALLSSIAALGLLATVPAQSALLTIDVFDGSTLVDTVTSSSGIASLATTDANFAFIAVNASGSPVLPGADLSTVTLNVQGSGGGTRVLTVDVFQTGVSAAAGSTLHSSFSTNDLIGAPGPTTEATFFNGANSTLGTPLEAHTFAAGDTVDHAGPFADVIGAPLFADAHQYQITFTAAGQSANDTIQLTTGVPEASTWAMMATGFAFLVWAAARRARPASAVA
jgi:hypothetical protein